MSSNSISFSKNLIKKVEAKFLENKNEKKEEIEVGDIVKVEYKVPEGNKERIQSYEGVIICIQNRTIGKSFTLRRNVKGIGVEQVFLYHSPKINAIRCKQKSKVRRAKLYFLRELTGKATRLKIRR
jgi:large subunit ribosomal protein L19